MSRSLSLSLQERERVETLIGEASRTLRGCLVYPEPYPKVGFRSRSEGLHRLACALNQPLREGELVLHECDEPRCVSPAHLRPGTHEENMADIARKNRLQLRRLDLSLPRTRIVAARRKGP